MKSTLNSLLEKFDDQVGEKYEEAEDFLREVIYKCEQRIEEIIEVTSLKEINEFLSNPELRMVGFVDMAPEIETRKKDIIAFKSSLQKKEEKKKVKKSDNK